MQTRRLAPASIPSDLTDAEQFDLKCIRIRNECLAVNGCGAKDCPVETCAVARHARVLLKAIAALESTTGARTSGRAPKSP
jgi:hypothetical protein